MRLLNLAGLATALGVLLSCVDCAAQANPRASTRSSRTSAVPSELERSRAEVLQRIKETREGAERLLALHEGERQRLAEEYQRRRELYQQGLIARNDVLRAEHALVQAMLKIDEDKRWIAETDSALVEMAMREELMGAPKLGIGGYSETQTLLRFNGGAGWRLADVARLEKFFFGAFGRALPISALGQTATHDRLRFDHRDAIDVALHPDSIEGKSLLQYLRKAGIPFVAFRGAVAGSSTGAHIHIGKPSPRL